MRPFEILTLILATGSFVALKTHQKRKVFLYLLFITSLCSILQYYFEGSRWQFTPITYSLPLMYIFHKVSNQSLTPLKSSFLIFMLVSGFILSSTIPVFQLPNPGGPHKIGTHTFHWVDSLRYERFTHEDTTDFREIIIQTWFPVKSIQELEPEPYLDFIEIRGSTMAAAAGLPSFLPGYLNYIKSNSFKSAVCIEKNMPVLIFSHGITGSRHLHQAMFEFFASRGYVVFAPDHSYDANITIFPNKKIADYRSEITGHPDSVNVRKAQMETRTLDISFIINQINKINTGKINSPLERRLDLNSIAVGGHSYGGATATNAAYNDARVKACFNLDGWISPLPEEVIKNGIKTPFLFIGRPSWENSDYPDNYKRLKVLFDNSQKPKYRLVLKKTKHLDYTDIPLYSPIVKYVIDVGDIPASKSTFILNNLVYEFLEKELIKSRDNNFDTVLSEKLISTF